MRLYEILRPQPSILRSKAFQTWFGDSQAKDANGRPWIVYHGTTHVFQIFDPKLTGKTTDDGWLGDGIYLTPDPNSASLYASSDRDGHKIAKGHVMPLFVKAENPFSTDRIPLSRIYVEEILSDGHDSIWYYDYLHDPMPKEIVVFDPHQVKSAISNRKFTADPDISK